MGKLEMKRADLLEVYERAYGERPCLSVGELKKGLEEKYARMTGVEIQRAGNPRGAGRKRRYTEEENDNIMELYRKGMPLRQISEKSGCSVGHVQDVIRERDRERNSQGYA